MTRRDPSRQKMRSRLALAVWLSCAVAAAGADDPVASEDADDGSFGMSPPVACKEVRGFGDYDPLSAPALTSDEKLLVYFQPRHYKTARVGEKYEAHFVQEGRIRRRGAKGVIWSKPKLLDFTASSVDPPRQVYLRNTISLKGLKPGEYDYDVVLHDAVGRSASAVRTLPFTIVEAAAKAEAPPS